MKTQEQLQAQVVAEHGKYSAAAREWWDARRDNAPLSEIRGARWRMEVAAEKYHSTKEQARKEFAMSRGWRVDTRCRVYPVTTYGEQGRQVIDHPDFFRVAGGIAGFITHTAAKVDEITAYAEEFGYSVELLPYSWYEPDHYTAALLTPKAAP
jgi:hypothetical protein